MIKRQPNIVWLLSDHFAYKQYADLPGPKPYTPTLNRIASEGAFFNNAYTVCPLCGPARASMLTGRYPHNHGIIQNDGNCGAPVDFEPDIRLFSHYLNRAGYRCGYFGKWHCGHVRTALDYGFEGWTLPDYGFPYNKDIYRDYLRKNKLREPVVELEYEFGSRKPFGRINLCEEPNAFAHMNCSGVLLSQAEAHESFFVTYLACKWLEQRSENLQPFLLRVDVWGPHQPYFVAAPFKDSIDPAKIPEYPSFNRSLDDRPAHHRDFGKHCCDKRVLSEWSDWRKVAARCYEHISLVDNALGSVLETLDRCGLYENTIVIYTTDHGDILASNGGLFDKGSMMVEETMRIPMAVRWPGRIKPGFKSSALVTNMDIVATVLDAAGAEMPPGLDGQSMLSLFESSDNEKWREELMCEHHGHAVDAFQRFLRWKNYKYVAHYNDIDELYDLDRDPFELRNRAEDPEMKDIRNEMRERLAKQMIKSGDNSCKAGEMLKTLT